VKFSAILVIAFLWSAAPVQAQDLANLTTQSEERQVWVNTATGVYHYSGTRWYGHTKQGKFMTEKDAVAQGRFSTQVRAQQALPATPNRT
jgi:hypothetical protein